MPTNEAGSADIVFAPAAVPARGQITRLRGQLAPQTQLVAVIEGADDLSPSAIECLFGEGIDDLIDPADAAAVLLCIARAKATFRRRQALHGEIEMLERVRTTLLAAMNNLPSPIFFKDADGLYRAFNTAFQTFYGKSREDILGASAFELTAFSTASTFIAADRRLITDGGVQIYETDVADANGAERHVAFYKSLVLRDDGSVEGIAGAMIDITERNEMEAQLREAANRDFLTGLYNRRYFMTHAETIMRRNQANGRPSYIAIADIDHFKGINDRYGHPCGDAVLRHVADILRATLGEAHLVARAGGEEFFIMLNCSSFREASRLVQRLRDAIAKHPYDWEDERLWVTASFGLTDIRSEERSLSPPLARADEALYDAKNHGRNQVQTMETQFVSDSGGI
ncbi:GGDEF domain-containing protein [Jiella mangrovi]|uniref:GGDEF domain-containing protein n=1 Tax=Jiella mangrovi TaxID=2821407 RepID=A0ABS4BJP1_9HYPH|nr:GGDEF domain-containing protein [Jiella mangrovi]MBP0616219.1 GGDEF domain-containing protein [Jiella mangrovi]